MAQEEVEIRYVKSPQWRVITATSAAVNSIGGPAGIEIHLRFTFEWTDVKAEKFVAEKAMAPGGQGFAYTVIGVPQSIQGPLERIEEVAVRMSPAACVGLVAAMLAQFSQWNVTDRLDDAQKQRIREAYAAFEKAP